ncbi:hypothetical protein OOZ19_15665 [Saccharopolyspora sp. NFXS83]|uniref:hypothetical protein n=1 Tax=Saccharopolyspora sp. NFXS83 TaxID=2993560 RepID=UPI00224B1B4B|nr:hypothetical protein [Saccharopolyspora sp. NFXS83]MCX2731680.1 hypothetical protein [Saccharopolyspora sp. NFXS83]
MAEGLARGRGLYRALCGLVVLTAEMSRPLARPCPWCLATLPRPARRTTGVLSVLLGHRMPVRASCRGTLSPRGTAIGPDRHGR